MDAETNTDMVFSFEEEAEPDEQVAEPPQQEVELQEMKETVSASTHKGIAVVIGNAVNMISIPAQS